jgi:hypothetical protein
MNRDKPQIGDVKLVEMKLVYTHENKLIVENARNLLNAEGIESVMRNEFSGGGAGDLPPSETWPELWVEESQYSQAKAIIDKFILAPAGAPWTCNVCGEMNEASFEICWKCQTERA